MDERQIARPHRISSRQVLWRFALRLTLFTVIAMVGTPGFRILFPTFMILSAISCALAAALRGEALFGRELTHWDEAAVYGALGCLVAKLTVV
jgi:hypothetical protein